MRSRYLRYSLEAKMAGVIHGFGGFIEIFFGNQWGMKIDESVKDTVVL